MRKFMKQLSFKDIIPFGKLANCRVVDVLTPEFAEYLDWLRTTTTIKFITAINQEIDRMLDDIAQDEIESEDNEYPAEYRPLEF